MAKSGDKKARSNSRRAQKRLTKRVTETELADFFERAMAAGYQTPQAYLTAFIAGHEGIDAEVRKDYIELFGHVAHIGANLNQIAKAVNSNRLHLLDPDHIKTIEAAYALARDLAAYMRSALRK